MINDLRALLRRNFFAGLLVVTPIAVSLWVLATALRFVWQLQEVLPAAWQPESYLANPLLAFLLKVAYAVGCVLTIAVLVSGVGAFSKQILGRRTLEFLAEDVIQKIPVVRSIYGALDQLLRTMAAQGGQQFSRVVYIEYPRAGVLTLAFVTGAARGKGLPPGHLNVYVPTTPNPTSGFYLIVPEREVRESGLTVEEAFKTLLSLGIAQPDSVEAAAPEAPADEPRRAAS